MGATGKNIHELWRKAVETIRYKIRMKCYGKKIYFYLYPSYLHSILIKKNCNRPMSSNYFTARPHPDAGIGHKMQNWIAGYYYAKFFQLNYVYMPFSNSRYLVEPTKWDEFLGFGADELTYNEVKKLGYKSVRLPRFKETDEDFKLIKEICDSYMGKNVVFVCEQDQYFRDQFLVREELREKFYAASLYRKGTYLFEAGCLNIAVHIRRGDIVQQGKKQNDNLTMRWNSNEYYYKILDQLLATSMCEENYKIFVFSQGTEEDFRAFLKYRNIKLCIDVSAQDSFEHMCSADILITSKSSFSYNPALLNKNGLKICPKDFWHGYPEDEKWVMADESNGILEMKKILNFLEENR